MAWKSVPERIAERAKSSKAEWRTETRERKAEIATFSEAWRTESWSMSMAVNVADGNRCASMRASTPVPVPMSSMRVALGGEGAQDPSRQASNPTFMAQEDWKTENCLKRKWSLDTGSTVLFCQEVEAVVVLENGFGIVCEITVHHPGIVGRVFFKDTGKELALVLAEVDNDFLVLVEKETTGEVDVVIVARMGRERLNVVGEVFVSLDLGDQHVVSGLGVSQGAVSVIKVGTVAVETMGGNERARFVLHEDGLRIDEFGVLKVRVDSRPMELLVEHRDIKFVAVVASEVNTREHFCQLRSQLLERRAGRHVFVRDVVDRSGFGRNGAFGIDAHAVTLLRAVGKDFDERKFDNAVVEKIDTGRLEVKKHERTLQIEFHESERLVVKNHRHEQHEDILALFIGLGEDDGRAVRIGDLKENIVRLDVLEDFDKVGGFESDGERVARVLASDGLGSRNAFFKILGGEDNLVVGNVKFDHVGSFGRVERGASERSHGSEAVDGERKRVVLRDDGIIVRVFAFNLAAIHGVVEQGELHHLVVILNGDVVVVLGKERLENNGRFACEDEGIASRAGVVLDTVAHEFVSIGSHEVDAGVVDVNEDARHDRAELVVRSGKNGLGDGIEER